MLKVKSYEVKAAHSITVEGNESINREMTNTQIRGVLIIHTG